MSLPKIKHLFRLRNMIVMCIVTFHMWNNLSILRLCFLPETPKLLFCYRTWWIRTVMNKLMRYDCADWHLTFPHVMSSTLLDVVLTSLERTKLECITQGKLVRNSFSRALVKFASVVLGYVNLPLSRCLCCFISMKQYDLFAASDTQFWTKDCKEISHVCLLDNFLRRYPAMYTRMFSSGKVKHEALATLVKSAM